METGLEISNDELLSEGLMPVFQSLDCASCLLLFWVVFVFVLWLIPQSGRVRWVIGMSHDVCVCVWGLPRN